MVKPELYKLVKDSRNTVIYRDSHVDLKQLERAANGAWFIVADLTFEFSLRDGREIKMTKQVRIRGQQTGTKPHKGGFKKKG